MTVFGKTVIQHCDLEESNLNRKVPLDWDICRETIANLKLTKDSMILDIGSKDGKKARYVLDKGNLIMSDLIPNNNLSPFVVASATFLPFRRNSFDLVIILHVIEHIKDDKNALKEIYRVLKEKGTMLLVTPNAKRLEDIYSFIIKVIRKSPHRYPLNPDHVFEYGAADIRNLLIQSEFTNYKIEPIFMKLSWFFRIYRYCNQWIVTAQK